jgi:hypothetical protein
MNAEGSVCRLSLDGRERCVENRMSGSREECRLSIKRSKSFTRPEVTSDGTRMHIAHAIVGALSGLGMTAFVFEPSPDTALGA